MRIELVSPDRTVFPLGDDLPIHSNPTTLIARVGDFTPAFWSRPTVGSPSQANALRISFPQGRAGQRTRILVGSTDGHR